MIRETDEREFSLTAHFAERALAFDDLQHEMAGRDVGRIARFLPADARDEKSQSKRRTEREETLTNLQIMMMNNPAYAALYRETEKTLRDAQTRLDEMLDTVLRAKEEARERLNSTLSDTVRAEEEARLETLTELETDIRTGQAGIGDMQLRIADQDDPVTTDDLESFTTHVQEIEADIEERMKPFREQSLSSEQAVTESNIANVEVPKL